MSQTVEAVYTDGVLKPLTRLPYQDQQRVRLTIEALDEKLPSDREAHLQELIDRLGRSTFAYGGPIPTREELHTHPG